MPELRNDTLEGLDFAAACDGIDGCCTNAATWSMRPSCGCACAYLACDSCRAALTRHIAGLHPEAGCTTCRQPSVPIWRPL